MRFCTVLALACFALICGCSQRSGTGSPGSSEQTVILANSAEQAKISTYPASPEEVAAGLAVVNGFLDALNRGDVTAGWSSTANELRAKMDEEKWKAMIRTLFSNAGKRGASQFRAVYKTSSDNNSGEVMLFGLVTQFEKQNIEETVTLAKDADGWKLAGYNWLQER
jgi:hypothetical protein